jgi:hypothetical protein
MAYVYIKSEPNCYTVGFYDPQGKFHAESDHESPDMAANRVAWLNGTNVNNWREEEARINEAEMWGDAGRPRWNAIGGS